RASTAARAREFRSSQLSLIFGTRRVAQYPGRTTGRRRKFQARKGDRRRLWLAGRYSINAHTQIIPRSLAGNRVGIGMVIASIRRQKIRDQVVEEECFAKLRGRRIKAPGAGTLTNCIPGPDRVRIDPIHQLDGDTNSTLTA